MRTTWKNKWLAMDVSKSPALQSAADDVESFCARWFANKPGKSLLMLCGEVRTGKTHLAKKIHRFGLASARAAFDRRGWGATAIPSVDFISWPELACQLGEKNRSCMDDAFSSSLLILDDVGAENDPWKVCADALCQILSRREQAFTVITTNVMPVSWGEKFDGRICDRFLRNSVVIDLSEVKPYVAEMRKATNQS